MVCGVVGTRWRVPVRVPVGKAIVVAVLLYLAMASRSGGWSLGLILLAAAGVALWAVRDLAVPVRLAADAGGVTVVTGLGRHVTLPWSAVSRVRVDTRRRSRVLEIDTGERLFVVSRYEVDADVAEVADRLAAMKAGARPR